PREPRRARSRRSRSSSATPFTSNRPDSCRLRSRFGPQYPYPIRPAGIMRVIVASSSARRRDRRVAALPVGNPPELQDAPCAVAMQDQLIAESLQPGVQAVVISRPAAAERLGHGCLPAEQAAAALLDAVEQRGSTPLP